MDQKKSNGDGHTNPPAYGYTPYPVQQGPYFPPSEQFGQTSTGYPHPAQQLNKESPYPPANQGHDDVNIAGGVPPIGFYMPHGQPQSQPINNDDNEPKFTPFHDDISGYAFSEKSIRMAFIRKVFGILSIQMAVTTGFIALFVLHEGIKKWTAQNSWFLFLMLALYLVTAFTLICCEGVRRTAPANYIFLGIFTMATSVVVGAAASTYDEKSVVLAAGVTVVVCVSLTLFAFQTKIDFTRFGGILFVFLIVLILFGFMTIFLRGYFPVTRMIYNALGALLFSAYLVHDVQLLVGGNHKHSISPEEYVFAALTIYLDIINIFLFLLRLFGQRN